MTTPYHAGSHTSVALVTAGAEVTIVDDLSNSFEEVLKRLQLVLKDEFSKITFHKVRTRTDPFAEFDTHGCQDG